MIYILILFWFVLPMAGLLWYFSKEDDLTIIETLLITSLTVLGGPIFIFIIIMELYGNKVVIKKRKK